MARLMVNDLTTFAAFIKSDRQLRVLISLLNIRFDRVSHRAQHKNNKIGFKFILDIYFLYPTEL